MLIIGTFENYDIPSFKKSGPRFSTSWQSIIEVDREVQVAYLKVAFTSDTKQSKELDVRSGKASVVIRALYRSVVLKLELSKKDKTFEV